MQQISSPITSMLHPSSLLGRPSQPTLPSKSRLHRNSIQLSRCNSSRLQWDNSDNKFHHRCRDREARWVRFLFRHLFSKLINSLCSSSRFKEFSSPCQLLRIDHQLQLFRRSRWWCSLWCLHSSNKWLWLLFTQLLHSKWLCNSHMISMLLKSQWHIMMNSLSKLISMALTTTSSSLNMCLKLTSNSLSSIIHQLRSLPWNKQLLNSTLSPFITQPSPSNTWNLDRLPTPSNSSSTWQMINTMSR